MFALGAGASVLVGLAAVSFLDHRYVTRREHKETLVRIDNELKRIGRYIGPETRGD